MAMISMDGQPVGCSAGYYHPGFQVPAQRNCTLTREQMGELRLRTPNEAQA